MSKDSVFESGKAIRGGIPLCWPWFGPYSKAEVKSGNHGFARQQTWQLSDIEIDACSVKIVLSWEGENMHRLWPNACELKQELLFGKTFSQTFYMTNTSEKDTQYTGALHSYFSVSHPENITIDKLDSIEFDDKISGKNSQMKPLKNCVGPIDRIYHSDQRMQIKDTAWQRVIEVQSFHAQQWVLWNPGVEIAESMVDIHIDGEREFVCLEAANTDAQLLKSGETVTLKQVISVNAL
jgi:glucose-6-phosphate 1-epimerase